MISEIGKFSWEDTENALALISYAFFVMYESHKDKEIEADPQLKQIRKNLRAYSVALGARRYQLVMEAYGKT